MHRHVALWMSLYCLGFLHCKSDSSSAPPPPERASLPIPADRESKAPPPAAAGEPEPTKAAAASASPPLLWEVKSTDGAHTSHLFGTMHIGVDADDDIHPIVWRALADSKEVVLEIISSELSFAETQRLLFLPNGETLREQLTDGQWEILESKIRGFPADQLPRISPLMASVLLTSNWLPMKSPLDRVIENRARDKKLEVSGLETFGETLQFAQNPAHIKYLALMLDDIDGAKSELLRMHKAYLAGDAEAMRALVFSPENREAFPELYEQLFYRRNQAWLSKIVERIDRHDTFVAVGAGHLLGDRSVIDLLEARGYTVDRVVPGR